MEKRLNDLRDLLHHELRDLYSAEKQITEALPKMAKAARSRDLRSAFEHHLEQTRKQVERLERVAKEMNFDIGGMECKAMKGIIKEGEEMIHEEADDAVNDAGLIAAAQRVEHYEIAGYGTVVTYLKLLGHDEHQKLLAETLKEERSTDEKLTAIAEEINVEARG
jgi:ferritin-like metal-binding protein YciE